MESITFTVQCEPQGKARARTVRNKYTGRSMSYTPQRTKDYEELIAYEYKRQCGSCKFECIPNSELKQPIRLVIVAYFKIPKSYTKCKRMAAMHNQILPTKKPDADNIAKVVCDALNGVAYIDDTQVVALEVYKYYTIGEGYINVSLETYNPKAL